MYVFAASIGSTGYSFRHLYASLPERLALIASVQHDPSVLALSGPVSGTSAGSLVAWKVLVFAAAAAGLMGIFTVVRHTRDDEEQGRLELVGAAVVGRQAPLAAGLAVAFGASLVLIPLIAVVQATLGYPLAGSVALGAAVGLSGCVFAAVRAVCAQLTVSARTARGMAVGALGVAFLLRAVGDAASGTSWLRWASPLGWAEQMRVYANPRWGVTILFVLSAAVLAGCAALLGAHRDLGAGLLPARAGRPQAPPWLRSPLALAWRLQRGALLGWAAGFVLAGAVLGSAARGIGADAEHQLPGPAAVPPAGRAQRARRRLPRRGDRDDGSGRGGVRGGGRPPAARRGKRAAGRAGTGRPGRAGPLGREPSAASPAWAARGCWRWGARPWRSGRG